MRIPPSSGTRGSRLEKAGLCEVRYISGLDEFLDELARRHRGLILDNCASGGRRLDFEMMRRCFRKPPMGRSGTACPEDDDGAFRRRGRQMA